MTFVKGQKVEIKMTAKEAFDGLKSNYGRIYQC